MSKPPIICLCGSTRWADVMAVLAWECEKRGAIVVKPNFLPSWYATSDHLAEAQGVKAQLDELHMRKIDLADLVVAVCFDVDGNPYMGESTRNEFNYALSQGKTHARVYGPSVSVDLVPYLQIMAERLVP